MTARELLPKPGFLLERVWIWIAQIAFYAAGFLLLAVFTPYWQTVLAIWDSPKVLAEMQASLVEMRAEVRQATGEDRVIRQPPGLSYVQEPVQQGENVILFMVAERTTLGRNCRLTGWTPLFTDSTNVTLPGSRLNAGPVSRQISDELTKLRIEIIPPAILTLGRIELYLALDYNCEGKQVPDRTDTGTYRLIARKP